MLPSSSLLLLAGLSTLGAIQLTHAVEYIFTAPGYLVPGTTANFFAVVRNAKSPGHLSVELWDRVRTPGRDDALLASQRYAFEETNSEKALEFPVPTTDPNKYYNLGLRLSGTFGDETFHNETSVYTRTVNDIVLLVQADKPKYRRGSTVNYRVLLVNKQLFPVENQKINITVNNPYNQIVFQQQEVELQGGLFQGTYKLLDVTEQGTWTITVWSGTSQGSTSFQVEDYVLPKFSVTITPDANDVQTNPSVNYKICAKYTYGQDVKGKVEIYASSFSNYYPLGQKPVILRVAQIDGCYDYTLNVTYLNTPNYTHHYYPSINVTAKVVEEGTGVTLKLTELHTRNRDRLRLNFNQKYDPTGNRYISQDDTFKHNLAYKGELYVQKLDGSPQPNEKIQLCLFVERATFKWRDWSTERVLACKNYTSDAEGVVHFTLPPFSKRIQTVNVEALAVDLPRIVVKGGPTLEKPSTVLNLGPFYSSSGNSIEINRKEKPAYLCKDEFSSLIRMTAEANVEYEMYFTLTSSSRILDAQIVKQKFAAEELESFKGDETLIENSPAPPGSKVPPVSEQESFKTVGSFRYNVTLPADASPKVQLLVYYVLRDAKGNPLEVVSDSRDFEVQKCLENKVSLTFSPEKAYPGSNVTVDLKAAGSSFCGVGGVDSSVTLIDGYSDRASRQSLLSKIGYLNYDYSRTSLVNQSYCYHDGYRYNEPYETEETESSLKRSKRQLLAPNGRQATDSLSSFENSGVVVFSNLPIQTRPCPNQAFPGYPNKQVLPSRSYHHPSFLPGLARPQAIAGVSKVGQSAFAQEDAVAPPGAAAFGGGGASPAGTTTVRTLFPETWLWQIKRVGEDGSVVYEETIPDTITRWEAYAVCLHPKAGFGLSGLANVTGFQPLFASLTLPQFMKRGEVATVVLTAFSYLDKCVAVNVNLQSLENLEIVSGPNSTNALLCPDASNSASFSYQVKATKLETSRLQATVATVPDAQSQHPGVDLYDATSSDTVIQKVEVRPEGFPIREVNTYLLCASDASDDSAPKSLQLSLPTPNALVEGSEQAVVVASGDILALEVKNLPVSPIVYTAAEGALSVLASSAYLLSYLQSTGSLKADVKSQLEARIQQAYQAQAGFRSSDGSYGVYNANEYPRSIFETAFAVKALVAAKPYVGNVDAEVLNSVNYLLRQQDKANGCFRVNANSLSGFDTNNGPDLSLTVGISLLESGYGSPELIKGVVACAEADNLPTNHTSSLKAYFYALAKEESKASDVLNLLLNSAEKNGGQTFWVEKGAYFGAANTAGNVILALKTLGRNLGEAQPIVRFLMDSVSARYAYSYSQAHAVATQALAEYSKVALATPAELTVDVTVKNSASDEPEALSFAVNPQNKQVYQEKLVSKRPPYEIQAALASGSKGCAAVQVKYYYYSKSSPVQRGLQLNVTASNLDCTTLALDICASYTEGFLSTSAIVQVTLPTGYSANDQSLKDLVNSAKIRKYVVTDNEVQLLIQQLFLNPTCFRVLENRDLKVDNIQPGLVELFDYYRYQFKASAGYDVPKDCVDQVPAAPTSENEIGSDKLVFE